MQDTSSLEYSLTATVCLESQQVLKLRQLVSTDDFSIPACATVLALRTALYHGAKRLMRTSPLTVFAGLWMPLVSSSPSAST